MTLSLCRCPLVALSKHRQGRKIYFVVQSWITPSVWVFDSQAYSFTLCSCREKLWQWLPPNTASLSKVNLNITPENNPTASLCFNLVPSSENKDETG